MATVACVAISLVFLIYAPPASACPICSGTAPRLTLLQTMINADRAVIARPLGGGDFEVLESIKASSKESDRRGTRLRKPKFAPGEDVPMRADAPSVLLLRQSLGGAWVVAGQMPASAAPAARLLVGAKRSTDCNGLEHACQSDITTHQTCGTCSLHSYRSPLMWTIRILNIHFDWTLPK